MLPVEPSCTYPAGTNRAAALVWLIATSMIWTIPAMAERLVTFEVTALGPHGDPVTDLRSDDCRVAEDGKTQAIGYFHFDGNRREAIVSLGPHEFSNHASFARIHPTVILLDLLS